MEIQHHPQWVRNTHAAEEEEEEKRASALCVQDPSHMLSLYRRPERCRLFQHRFWSTDRNLAGVSTNDYMIGFGRFEESKSTNIPYL
jgi:hypothetical protein